MTTYKDKLHSWSTRDLLGPRKTNSKPQLSEEEVEEWMKKNHENLITCPRAKAKVLMQNCGHMCICYQQTDCMFICPEDYDPILKRSVRCKSSFG